MIRQNKALVQQFMDTNIPTDRPELGMMRYVVSDDNVPRLHVYCVKDGEEGWHECGTATITSAELAAFMVRFSDVTQRNPRWRAGQTAFNMLHDTHPHLANELRGGDCDPFYRDDYLPQFFEYLIKSVQDL